MSKKKKAGSGGAKKEVVRKKKKPAREPLPEETDIGLSEPAKLPPFPIVAIGASAGGLEAATQILEELPANPGVSIVIVQHLSPKVASLLPELLAGHSKLPVHQVEDEMNLVVNHVYVIPPDRHMALHDGHLLLKARPSDRSQYTPIDFFFASVAEHAQSRGIGIVLSGTASDGANGIRAIKAAGGIAIVQQPESAKYDGMPRAALATQMVDLVLEPREIAHELVRIVSHPYVRETPTPIRSEELTIEEDQLRRIFQLLRNATGVDFTHYKLPTVRRRLQRRMALQKITNVDHYLTYLEQNQAEVHSLYQDILIHVTKFFREPESFEVLKDFVLPRIFESHKDDAPIRIWVPGCSTGEEPYSVAITLLELLEERAANVPIQIFATDLSEAAIERARAGIYPESINADVSEARLRRFFARVDGNYQISKAVRDLCVFARQDLTRDPPFSKLDLIVCRNVLIYLGAILQKKLMTLFHYALRSNGYLMLGQAETVGIHADLFSMTDKKHRVYSKKAVETPTMALQVDYKLPRIEFGRKPTVEAPAGNVVQGEATRILLDRYTPPAVIVDADLQILQFRGHTGPFLEPALGDASLNLLKMAREGLIYGLRTALRAARKGESSVRRDGLQVKYDGRVIDVDLEVVPLGPPTDGRHFLILFHNGASQPAKKPAAPKSRKNDQRGKMDRDTEFGRLQQELAASREYLQSIIQDLEAANEELQSANEEILSSNEELQSTNEELDTAKEELQSTNEELNTLNEELHGRNEELSRVNSDLVNLLGSVQIAIVMVSGDLRIRRFTPMAEKILNLIPADAGRPIGHIKPNIDCPELEQLIGDTIDNMTTTEREVRDAQGHWYSLRIRPYKNVENRIDGAVLALFDVDASKRQEEREKDARSYADSLLDTVTEPLLILDPSLKVLRINAAFRERFGVTAAQQIGRPIFEFMDGQWDGELRGILEKVVHDRQRLQRHAVDLRLADGSARSVFLNSRWFDSDGDGNSGIIILTVQDALPGT